MLITVNKNRYKIIIQIIGGHPLQLHWMPDSKAGRRNVKCSDITWARSTQSSHGVDRHQLVFLVVLALSLMIPLSSKQSESSSSCNVSSGSN